jgi:predicted secreted protein
MKMPKYKVHMNVVEARVAEFVVEAKDPDELHDLIGEIDLDFFEENLIWTVTDYEPPVIENYEKVNKDTPVDKSIQKEMNEVLKAWEAL